MLALGKSVPPLRLQGGKQIFDLDVYDSRLLPLQAYDSILSIGVANLDPGEDTLVYLW